MDLHQLEYIVEIANMRSISRAAENLYITQSTLSQFLSKLEAELGVNLFERNRKEMTLTFAGKLYVDTCLEMLQKKKDLYQQLYDITQSKTGSFSLGITPQWGSVAYSHIIGPFREAYPNMNISVTEEIATPLIRLLKEGQLDMAIIPLPDNTELAMGSILLQAEELILAIPRSHTENLLLNIKKGEMPVVNISDLKNEPMIFSQKKTTIRELEDRCFASQNTEPRIITEINSHPASLIMVEQGLGSTFVPVSCAAPSEKIVYARTFPILQWYVVFAFRKGFSVRQSEKYFINLVKEFFSQSSIDSILIHSEQGD